MSMTLSLGPLALLQLEIVAKYGHPGAQAEGDEGEEDDHEDLSSLQSSVSLSS